MRRVQPAIAVTHDVTGLEDTSNALTTGEATDLEKAASRSARDILVP